MPQIRSSSGRRTASIGSNSFDRATRTFEFEVASETPCPSYRMARINGEWRSIAVQEVLAADGCVNLGEAEGLPIVDSHNYSSIKHQLGIFLSARREGTKIVGRGQLSSRDDVAVYFDDIESGIIGSISAGYDPIEDEPFEPVIADGAPAPTVRVRKWRLKEASIVALPADPTVSIRSKPMTTTPKPNEAPATPVAPAVENQTITVSGIRAIAELFGFSKRSARDDSPMDDDSTRGTGCNKRDGDPVDDDGKGKKKTEEAAPGSDPAAAESARKERAAAVDALRGVVANSVSKRMADFDALVKTGADLADLNKAVCGFIATSTPEIRSGGAAPAAPVPAQRGGELTFETSSVQKRYLEQLSKRMG